MTEEIFCKYSYFILSVLFLMLNYAYLPFAILSMFYVSLCSNYRIGFLVALSVIVLTILLLLQFGQFNAYYWINSVHKYDLYSIISFTLALFIPSLTFQKVMITLNVSYCWFYSHDFRSYQEPKGMSWSKFFAKGDKFSLSRTGGYSQEASLWDCIVLSTGIFLLCWLLTWYLDNVLQSNRGVAKPFYFFLTKRYWQTWGLFQSQNKVLPKPKKKKSKKEYSEADIDPVLLEKKLVLEAEKKG